jgi:hypothetical protein
VATGLGASLLLEPRDELGDGEGLWESRATVASGRSSRSRGSSGGRRLLGNWGRRADWGSGLGRSSRRDRRGRLGGCSRCSGCSARASAVPDLGAGNWVACCTTVDVEQDTGVGGTVRLGHVSSGGRKSGRAARHADLTAAVVELGALRAVTLVEGNDLGTDEVVAVGEVREGDSDLTLVRDELLNGPFAVGQTLFEDLGPDGTFTLGRGLCDVDHDWTLVGSSNGPGRVVSM